MFKFASSPLVSMNSALTGTEDEDGMEVEGAPEESRRSAAMKTESQRVSKVSGGLPFPGRQFVSMVFDHVSGLA